jgi:hypothetical protein
MKLSHDWKLKLSPLAEVALGRPLVEPFIELVESGEYRLCISSSHGEFVFDREARVVLRSAQVVADFDSVRSVDISSLPGREDSKSWALSLYLSFFQRITVGRTYDDGQASVLASRLAAVLGCKVLAMGLKR